MTIIKLHFIKPGMFTLVQDAGRMGFQKYGVPISGAMDKTAMHLANWLVGNNIQTPVLEITMIGPEVRVMGNCQAAITGADISPSVNGQHISMYETLELKNGDTISFGKLKNGCRSYLSIRGGWQLGKWLDSSSTAVFNGKEIIPGGLIKKGDSIKITTKPFIKKKVAPENLFPFNYDDNTIKVLPGPEFELFSRTFIAQFFSCPFRISTDSNRMGYRLEGNIKEFVPQKELISSGTPPGTIQITHSGLPVLLLSDAQTTGGYYRIANVISANMDRLAQKKPGDEIRFEMVGLEEAYQALELMGKKWGFLN